MSFVTEVLVNTAQREKEDFSTKLSELSKEILEAKLNVYEFIKKKYGSLDVMLERAIGLHDRVHNASTEMQILCDRIENEVQNQLNVSASEFEQLCTELEESKSIIAIVKQLLDIDVCLKDLKDALDNKHYVEAVVCLNSVQAISDHCASEFPGDIQILSALKTEINKQQGRLDQEIGLAWNKLFNWTLLDKDSVNQITKLCIQHTNSNHTLLVDTASAMYMFGHLTESIVQFGRRMMTNLITPILCGGARVEIKHGISNETELQIHHCSSKRNNNDMNILSESLCVIMKYLVDCGFNELLTTGTSNDASLSSITLMSELGNVLDAELLNIIITQCLAKTIPSTQEQLNNYENTAKVAEKLERDLIACKILRANNRQLTEYVGKIDSLFIEKQCQEVLIKAEKLMKFSLHNHMRVSKNSLNYPLQPLLEGRKGQPKQEQRSASVERLSDDMFHFPSCSISSSTNALITMVEGYVSKLDTENPVNTTQLFFTLRQVFELYCDVVPTYHKINLEKLPELSALHYTNCMFVAHSLQYLGNKVNRKLPSSLCQTSATMIDLVSHVRAIGKESLRKQLVMQRDIMFEALTLAKGFVNLSDGSNKLDAERAIKQVIYQIQLLCNVWKPILPWNIYCQSIGTLVNAVLVEIMGNVIGAEDIAADDATQLYSLFTILVSNIDQFYVVPDGVEEKSSVQVIKHRNIWKLNKLNEVMLVLNGSLNDISDRWADGKGPLAHEVTNTELKQLIRALFQNTDRRAAVLAKIR